MKDLKRMDKTYFLPGDVVTIRQDIPNKPTMIVVGKMDKESKLQGIKCKWFTKEGILQEDIFNTKDLIPVK